MIFRVARAADIRRAVAFAKRHGMKPVIAGGEEAWVVAQELADDDIPVLLDALANLPASFDSIGSRLDNAALLHRAGVRIGFTQFGESHNARKIRQLAGNAVAHGLPAEAALAALTARPAEIFGVGANRGRIARGQDRRPRALERRPAGSDDGCRSGLDQRPRHRDALAADRTARPVSATPAHRGIDRLPVAGGHWRQADIDRQQARRSRTAILAADRVEPPAIRPAALALRTS